MTWNVHRAMIAFLCVVLLLVSLSRTGTASDEADYYDEHERNSANAKVDDYVSHVAESANAKNGEKHQVFDYEEHVGGTQKYAAYGTSFGWLVAACEQHFSAHPHLLNGLEFYPCNASTVRFCQLIQGQERCVILQVPSTSTTSSTTSSHVVSSSSVTLRDVSPDRNDAFGQKSDNESSQSPSVSTLVLFGIAGGAFGLLIFGGVCLYRILGKRRRRQRQQDQVTETQMLASATDNRLLIIIGNSTSANCTQDDDS